MQQYASQLVVADLPVETMAVILSVLPPGRPCRVSPLVQASNFDLELPPIFLHCQSALCDRVMLFDPLQPPGVRIDTWTCVSAVYRCRHCREHKVFGLLVNAARDGSSGGVLKIGEWPPFGPPLPSRLMKLVGPDRELLLKGYRAEKQGMGMGAFAYYRRVVDNQRVRLFDDIIKIARQVNADAAVIHSLEQARQETQFSRAMEIIKPSVPESLLINGHNPLRLLYAALSQHLHVETDEKCLELASSIRVVLAALAERMENLAQDDADLRKAVGRLMKPATVSLPEAPSTAG